MILIFPLYISISQYENGMFIYMFELLSKWHSHFVFSVFNWDEKEKTVKPLHLPATADMEQAIFESSHSDFGEKCKECQFFPRLFKLFRLHSNKRSRSYICHGDSASLKNKLLIQRKSYTANYIILYWSRRPKPKWKTRIDGKKERKTERMKGIIVVYI